MSEVKIIGDAVKNMPWQEARLSFPVHRYGDTARIRSSEEIR